MAGFVPLIARRPAGITLMEVLIAVGILSIGLTSVLAILPAGGSQAAKAVVYDRAAILAANSLADAVTSGCCRIDGLNSSAAIVTIDALGQWAAPSPPTPAAWQQAGVFSGPSTPSVAVGSAAAITQMFLQGKDDVELADPPGPDELPRYLEIEGTRAFAGRFTAALLRTSLDGAPIAEGSPARISAVVFHNRAASPAEAFVPGTLAATGQITLIPPPGRSLNEIVRPGVVFFDPIGSGNGEHLHLVTSAAIDATSNSAFVTYTGTDLPAGSSITVLMDSVGLAERIVTIEGPSGYTY
jgi:type II secretory pathway pseudopilin PulG